MGVLTAPPMTPAHKSFVSDWQQEKPVSPLAVRALGRVWVPPTIVPALSFCPFCSQMYPQCQRALIS